MPVRPHAPRALAPLVLATTALGMAGCGQGGTLGTPHLPLVNGAQVVQRSRLCDKGKNVFCALYEVVVDGGYRGSESFMSAERKYLHSLGWSVGQATIGQEQTAVSPDHKYRLTYATDEGELRAIDLGWVQRPSAVSLALGRAMFSQTAALEVTIAAGPS